MNDKKILIADDEPHLLLLLERTLEEELDDHDVEVLTARDGQAALDLIQEERPRLAVLDVMMPKVNGFDVCSRVKSDPELQDTFIIILTAKGQQVDREKAEEVGANRYITKPFDPEEILELTLEVLGLE